MTPEQCRMARGAFNWTVRELAVEAGLAPNTILAFEAGHSVRDSTPARIREVFEKKGVRFETKKNSIVVELEKT